MQSSGVEWEDNFHLNLCFIFSTPFSFWSWFVSWTALTDLKAAAAAAAVLTSHPSNLYLF